MAEAWDVGLSYLCQVGKRRKSKVHIFLRQENRAVLLAVNEFSS